MIPWVETREQLEQAVRFAKYPLDGVRGLSAERFWRGQGFVEMRRREGFKKGQRTSQLVVMAKALDEGTWHDYARLVPRDQPGAP